MADTYFVSFVIREDETQQNRYDTLIDALRRLSPRIWWAETPSFVILSSDQTIDYVAAVVKFHIDASQDIAIIGKTEYTQMRVCGAYADEDIFKLVPAAKRA